MQCPVSEKNENEMAKLLNEGRLFLDDERLDPYQRAHACVCMFDDSLVQQAMIQQGHWASGDGYGQCVIIYN